MTSPATTVLSLAQRREGFLIGAVIGASLAAATADAADVDAIRAALGAGGVGPARPPAERRRAPIALADALLDELVGGGVDLHRLARSWVAWHRDDGLDADPLLAEALTHLATYDAPPPILSSASLAPMAAALPAALASSSPQGMVAGAFHVAHLLDPGEESALAAVSMVVAASRLLEGHRDFIADVIAVLRANDAQASLLEAVARVPRDPKVPPPIPRGVSPSPMAAVSWMLWHIHHRPRGVHVLEQMVLAGSVSVTVGAVLGALLGARDGVMQWPKAWMDGAGEDVALRRAFAFRLAESVS